MHGVCNNIEGGRQLPVAPEPVTGSEWCEYFGINIDKCDFAISNIDRKIYESISEGATGSLDMSKWHTCETTHCRAGWAIQHAGEAGKALEKKFGAEIAGKMIYAASRPEKPLPNFFASTSDALE